MANRGQHFTSEMGGSLANALSHPAMGQFVGSVTALAVLTSPIWLTVWVSGYSIMMSVSLIAGGPEAAAVAARPSPYGPAVLLLAPWLAFAVVASAVHESKSFRRRGLPAVVRRAETAGSRRWAIATWGIVLAVAVLGAFSGVYAEAAFRIAHPGLDSRLIQACPHLYPGGEANRTRILGDPIPGIRHGDTPGFKACWPYIVKADQERRCLTPSKGLPSEREALPGLCAQLREDARRAAWKAR